MPARYSLDRGTRVTITTGKYAGCQAIIDANVYDKSADYPEERAPGFQVTVFVGEEQGWATVRVEQISLTQHYQ